MRDHSKDGSVQVMGHTLKYYVEYDCDEYHDSWTTHFYKESTTIKRRRWLLFGEWIEVIKPKILFSIFADANSPNLSKDWWKQRIEDQVYLLYRKEELKKGELI